MSLLVFPTFPATGFDITFPIKQTPLYNTITQTPASGRGELRISTMQFPRWDFAFKIDFLKGDNQGTNTAWQQLLNFFMGVQGAASDWLFLHPYDNIAGSYSVSGGITSGNFIVREQVTQTSTGATAQLISVATAGPLIIGPYTAGTPDNSHTWVGQKSGAVFTPSTAPALSTSQAFATGDGSTKPFSIIRSLVTGGAQDLVQNFVFAPSIYDNGAIVNPVNYTIDQYGTITFTVAPTAGHTLSWTGQFYYRCHFLDDFWDQLHEDFYQLWSIGEIKFRSVLL